MVFSAPHNTKNVALDARRAAVLAVLAVLATLVVVGSWLLSPEAQARSYYKYWGYWHKPPGATSWQYSKVGASGYYLQQGDQVEGWRFAVGTAGPSDPQPRPTTASYDGYCKDQNSSKAYRVLLVVDYGTESDAPTGPVYSCYGFDSSVNGFTVLTQQHTERDSNGLICAIDSYPRSGCGETVNSPAPKTSPTPRRTTSIAPARSQPAAPASTAATTGQPTPSATTATPGSARTPVASNLPTNSDATSTTSSSQTSAQPFTGKVSNSKGTGFPFGLVIGLAAAAGVGAAAWWRLRRAS